MRLHEMTGKQAAVQTAEQIAQTFDVGPRLVRGCFKEMSHPVLEQRGLDVEVEQPLPSPRWLGIDEFASRKGHRYATTLCDLEKREVLEVCLGRKLEDVSGLLKRLANSEQVKAVSLDISASFASAVRTCLPHVQIVVDHFHVIQHLMKAFRKVVSSWAYKKEG